MNIRDHLMASAAVKEKTADICAEATEKAAMAIASSLRSGGKLMLLMLFCYASFAAALTCALAAPLQLF